jgi:hypothetical protein
VSQVQITDETKIHAGRSAHGGIREGQENRATLDRIGSKFRVQARPGAAGWWYEIIFNFYERGFSSAHLDWPDLGQGFKGYNRRILLNILIKVQNKRLNPLSDTAP